MDQGDSCDAARPTPRLTILYGQVAVNGQAAKPGSIVEFVTPTGTVAGCGLVREDGLLPLTHVYGADGGVPGFDRGEPIAVRVNGVRAELAEPLSWEEDRDLHPVTVRTAGYDYYQYLPLVAR